MSKVQNAAAWLQEPEFAGVQILDPDGWRGQGRSWDDEITKAEFEQRLMECTLRGLSNDQSIRVWHARLYQGSLGGKPFEQWAPCYYSDGWADGEAKLCMNLNDIGIPYTRASARAEAKERNLRTLMHAEKGVSDAKAMLGKAQAHLARVRAALPAGAMEN